MAQTEQRKKLPIPLTCRPQIENGKCVHSFDNGACRLADQFMCPYYLWFEQEHPEKVGEAPREMIDGISAEKPIDLKFPPEMMRLRASLDKGHDKAKNKRGENVRPAPKRRPEKTAVKKAAAKKR